MGVACTSSLLKEDIGILYKEVEHIAALTAGFAHFCCKGGAYTSVFSKTFCQNISPSTLAFLSNSKYVFQPLDSYSTAAIL